MAIRNNPRLRGRPRLRRLVCALAVAAAALTVGCGGGDDSADRPRAADDRSSASDDSRKASVGSADVPVADGTWDTLPEINADGYQNLQSVSDSGTAVIVSGVDSTQSTLKTLTFDLQSERWARSTSPLWWRFGFSAVSTEDQVIVWGGCCGPGGQGSRAEGMRFRVADAEWVPMTESPLDDRHFHSAVWTGEAMIIWGGALGTGSRGVTDTGAAYDPAADRWTKLAATPIDGRSHHVAVWTGEEMIIWGGTLGNYGGNETKLLSTSGAAYNPQSDSWREIAAGPIRSRAGAEGVWTGEEMIVWNEEAGAAYDPTADAWRSLPEAPRGLAVNDTVVWTGDEMIVWGGRGASGPGNGISYDPATDDWARLPEDPLAERDRHTAVSTTDGMLVWGGCCADSDYYSDGAIYAPGGTPSGERGEN